MKCAALDTQSGIAGVIAALILMLLNTAAWVVMNTAGEAQILMRNVRNHVAYLASQRIVDNAASVIENYCNDLLLPGGQPRTVSLAELQSGEYRIDADFRELYRKIGLEIDDSVSVELTAILLDRGARIPAVNTEALSGLQTTLRVGSGNKRASRIFTLPVLVRRVDPQSVQILACENSDLKNSCYMGSVAIRAALPAVATSDHLPLGLGPTAAYDRADTYARLGCFADSLRTPTGCTEEANTLASAIRACVEQSRLGSALSTSNPEMSGPIADTCGGLANSQKVVNGCAMVLATQSAGGAGP